MADQVRHVLRQHYLPLLDRNAAMPAVRDKLTDGNLVDEVAVTVGNPY